MAFVNLDKIPEQLKQGAFFCGWRYETRKDKNGKESKTKVPYNLCTGKRAKSNDKSTFCRYFKAVQAFNENGKYDGLGVGVFNNLIAFDIDHTINERGELSEEAKDIISTLNTYCEKSPSGKGIRLFGLAKNYNYDTETYYIKNGNYEIYAAGNTYKFLTVTGDVIEDKRLADVSKTLPVICKKYMKRKPKEGKKKTATTSPCIRSDAEIIEKARNNNPEFENLFNGNIDAYKSQSEADFSLCLLLCYWCEQDAQKIDSIFRQSGLMRKKWDSKNGNTTYGAKTIENALKAYRENPAQPAQSGGNSKVKIPKIVRADELQKRDLPPVYFAVDQVLPKGVSAIASPPKYGKSWLALDLLLSVCRGADFMGFKTTQSACLYCDLETYDSAIQERLNVLEPNGAPHNMCIVTMEPAGENIPLLSINNGLLNQLEQIRNSIPEDIKVICLDIFERVRDEQKRNQTQYSFDYAQVKALSDWGLKNEVAIIILTHTTKFQYSDPLMNISGSSGILGAVDSAIMMQKDDRFDDHAILSIVGKYQKDPIMYNVEFNRDNGRWHYVSTADINSQETRERLKAKEEYENSIIRNALLKFMQDKAEWKGKARTLKEDAFETGITIFDSPKNIGAFLSNTDNRMLMSELDNLSATIINNGTGSKIYHIFRTDFVNVDDPDEIPFEE